MPKPLLNVGSKPMIEHILKKIDEVDKISKIYIVTNAKFEQHFKKWLKAFDAKKPIEIISDGTTSNETRLGALGDINYAIEFKKISGDLLVVAGDNLFEASLLDVFDFFKKRNGNVIVLYDVKDFELARQYGIVEVKNNIVVNFEEKPVSPKSTLASTGIYFFPKKTIQIIKKYIAQGNNPDKTGSFIEWLYKREAVYSYTTDKKWYDIGSFEQLEKVNKEYKKK